MALNRFEKQIKKQLEAREIIPTENAWNKLDAMLEKAEKKEKKPTYLWWYVAASIVTFFGVVFFTFNKNNKIENTNEVIVVKESKTDSVINKIAVEPTKIENKTIKNSNLPVAENTKNNFVTTQKVTKKPQKNQPVLNNATMIANQERINEAIQNEEVILKDVKPIEKISINSNALLAAVESNLKVEKTTIKANSTETNTFREKMIKKLEKNYQKAKVAIVTRNLE